MATAAGIVALIAVALGVVGAILLANIAIRPIGRLVKAVSAIRDTEDKSTARRRSPWVPGTRSGRSRRR